MKHLTLGERIFTTFNYLFLTLLTLAFIIPIWSTLVTSFVSESERAARGAFILYPQSISFLAYRYIFSPGSTIYASYRITIFRIIIGTFCSLVVTSMFAYALAQRSLPFRKTLTMYVFIPMLFSGGLVPSYLWLTRLGFQNNLLVYILPALINPFWMFLMRNFFMQIPRDIEESAFIDGAKPLYILIKIIIPISIPAIATIGLFYAVSQWVSWFDAFLYMNRMRLMPVQNYLRNILFEALSEMIIMDDLSARRPPTEAVRAAVIVVTTVPVTLIYPKIQKYFVKGIMVGSIKG